MKPEMLEMLHRAIGMAPVVREGEPLLPRVTISVPALEAFATLVIADFLQRTGQYVTNDATREAALEAARVEERERILRTVPGDWQAAYDAFKSAAALPNDAPALKYSFAAGMATEREACAKVADDVAGSCLHPDEIAEHIRARGTP